MSWRGDFLTVNRNLYNKVTLVPRHSVSSFGVDFLEVLGLLKVFCIPKILLKRSPKVKQNVGLSMVV